MGNRKTVPNWSNNLLGLPIAIMVFILFIPALDNGFVNWDDPLYVLNNNSLLITGWHSFIELIFNQALMNWHPLTNLSLALDYAIWGKDPFGYHLSNNLIHSLNSLCVYLFTLSLLSCKTLHLNNRQLLISASLTAILFALHPLRVESVAWISERKDVLYALFYLLTLIAYIAYVKAPRQQRLYRYAILCLLFVLALLSKAMAVTLPALLLILDIYPLGRIRTLFQFWQMLKEKLPLFLLSLLFTLVAFQMQGNSGALKTLSDIPLWDRAINAVYAYMFYLKKLFMPLDLSPFYPHPALTQYVISTPAYVFSATLFSTLTIASLIRWRAGSPQLAAAWGAYLLITLPVIGLIHIGGQSAADRYTYLSLIGICMLVSVTVAKWIDGKPWQRYCSLGLIFLALPLMLYQTQQQITIWKDSGRLWERAIALYPMTDALPYFSLGLWHEHQPQGSALAIADYTTAIILQPAHWDALQKRGILLAESGDNLAALKDFNRAIALTPNSASGYINRGSLHHRLGNLAQATLDYQQALKIEPQHPVAQHNLGLIQQQR